MKNLNFDCCVGVIYGPNDRELNILIQSLNKHVLLLGDFNVVLHPEERVGTFRCEASMSEFAEWIHGLG